jgi:hypothetical protein
MNRALVLHLSLSPTHNWKEILQRGNCKIEIQLQYLGIFSIPKVRVFCSKFVLHPIQSQHPITSSWINSQRANGFKNYWSAASGLWSLLQPSLSSLLLIGCRIEVNFFAWGILDSDSSSERGHVLCSGLTSIAIGCYVLIWTWRPVSCVRGEEVPCGWSVLHLRMLSRKGRGTIAESYHIPLTAAIIS